MPAKAVSQIEIPDLKPEAFRSIGVCLHFDAAGNQLAASFLKRSDGFKSFVEERDDENLVIRRIVDRGGKNAHFHLEIGYEASAIWMPSQAESVKENQLLQLPAGLEIPDVSATIWGQKRFRLKRLGPKNLISLLSGLTGKFGDYDVSLSGGVFDVTSGKGPLREVRWTLISDSVVNVQLCLYGRITLDKLLLTDSASRLETAYKQIFGDLRSPRLKARKVKKDAQKD